MDYSKLAKSMLSTSTTRQQAGLLALWMALQSHHDRELITAASYCQRKHSKSLFHAIYRAGLKDPLGEPYQMAYRLLKFYNRTVVQELANPAAPHTSKTAVQQEQHFQNLQLLKGSLESLATDASQGYDMLVRRGEPAMAFHQVLLACDSVMCVTKAASNLLVMLRPHFDFMVERLLDVLANEPNVAALLAPIRKHVIYGLEVRLDHLERKQYPKTEQLMDTCHLVLSGLKRQQEAAELTQMRQARVAPTDANGQQDMQGDAEQPDVSPTASADGSPGVRPDASPDVGSQTKAYRQAFQGVGKAKSKVDIDDNDQGGPLVHAAAKPQALLSGGDSSCESNDQAEQHIGNVTGGLERLAL